MTISPSFKYINVSLSLNTHHTNFPQIKLRSISWLIDNALDEIESHRINDKPANPKLKGVLPRISRYEVENTNLTELINRFSDTSFSNPEFNGKKLSLKSKDILGHVYEYFLGQFALAEGKQGGQYYIMSSLFFTNECHLHKAA